MSTKHSPRESYPCCFLYWLLMFTGSAFAQGTNSVMPPGYRLIEGDILVRDGEFKPAAVFQNTLLWPGGQVPYEFGSNVSAANRDAMLGAMAEWQSAANVRFVVRTDEDDYVHIQDSTMNSSAVGKQGGKQPINIVSWNSKWIIAHELAHALGFWHEQSRVDRDHFIQVNLNNVAVANRHNFDIHDEASHYGPYDFDSVMHYGATDFSINTQSVITVLPPNDVQWQSRIGQRDHLSFWDRRVMSFLYKYPDWLFVDRDFDFFFHNGTFRYPFQDFSFAVNLLPAGGTIWMQPGTYATGGSLSKPMTIQAPLGSVTLTP